MNELDNCKGCVYLSDRLSEDWMLHDEDWRLCNINKEYGVFLVDEEDRCINYIANNENTNRR